MVVTIDQAAFSAGIIERRRRRWTLTSVTSDFNWRTLLTELAHTHRCIKTHIRQRATHQSPRI